MTLYFIHKWKTEQNNQSESLSITTYPKQIFYYAITTSQLNNETYVFQPPAANELHHNCWWSTST